MKSVSFGRFEFTPSAEKRKRRRTTSNLSAAGVLNPPAGHSFHFKFLIFHFYFLISSSLLL